ncbi:hypothetical protein [Pedobacter cryoconitis]|uniref:Uncharacterized protein n=1 Tax=Pedobacter cryoconitis TaxID=188932 RepID=A0A7X0MIG7_9SPHI|nr:hypothetical protein [Pedobacter cryoconitis]MBB6498423.1 hypothetical protein [Pedobacter cryoconitis]
MKKYISLFFLTVCLGCTHRVHTTHNFDDSPKDTIDSTKAISLFEQVNLPENFSKLETYFKFVPHNINTIKPIEISDKLSSFNIKNCNEITNAARLNDGTIFIVSDNWGEEAKSSFVYLKPIGGNETVPYQKIVRKSYIAPNDEYMWFLEDFSTEVSDGYNLKLYDIVHKKCYDFKDLVSNSTVFQDIGNKVTNDPDYYDRGKGIIPFSMEAYDFHLTFTNDGQTDFELVCSIMGKPGQSLKYKSVHFILPDLKKLLQKKIYLEPTSTKDVDKIYRIYKANPYSVISSDSLKITNKNNCLKNVPYSNVEMNFGLPYPVPLLNSTSELRGFYFYLTPKTMKPTAMDGGEGFIGTSSTENSARFTGAQIVSKNGCLEQLYVHGIGVVHKIYQYKHYIITANRIENPNTEMNRLIVWDLNTNKAILALEQSEFNSGSVDYLFFDEAKKEIIGIINYTPCLFKWKTNKIFDE